MSGLSKSKLAALAAARQARASAQPRTGPDGWRSPEHLLDDTREFLGRHAGLTAELARYLRVNEGSVRRWVKREKMPVQSTLEQIAQWRRVKKTGL